MQALPAIAYKSRSPDCFKFYDSVIRDFEGYHVAEGLIHLDIIFVFLIIRYRSDRYRLIE
jgi:hypothetical protein